MSTNIVYLNHSSIEKTAFELIDICNKCPLETLASKYLKDTYTSPAWTELKRALTVDDIPMQSCYAEDIKNISSEMDYVPWHDSIKNFIFDTTSVNTSKRFATCILLSEMDYNYQEATIHMIAGKYGLDNVTLIDVTPVDTNSDGTVDEFKFRIRHKDIRHESIVSSQALTSDLVQWYVPNSTLIFCHDNSILQYQTTISMMPRSTWSISCTKTNYIINKDSKARCDYVCPIFSFPLSSETRAVSFGTVQFTNSSPPSRYQGKLDYYSRCVRFSRHSSGKCYDCYKLLNTVHNTYKSPLSTPVSSKFVKFNPSFIKSLSTSIEDSEENSK